ARHLPPIQTNAPAVPPHAARNGYRTGFGLSVLVAACCVGLYIATPKLAAQDLPFGAGLMQLRTEVDQARLWLSDRVTGPDGQTGRLNAP
ncbi:MAG: hypothetical protein L0G27_08500, partial [Paracoccus sp. (in: a-proteobacteria)]|nr:hypothetical protein [Paracoccus sp. (in: a-proteobacteria)]